MIKGQTLFWCMAITVLSLSGFVVKVGMNMSDSLPYRFVLATTFLQPKHGDLVFFNAPDTAYPTWTDIEKPKFTKIVLGMSGDKILVSGRAVTVNGVTLYAKEKSELGRSLEPITGGIVPEGKIFVYTRHKDSYDSRYAEIGLIDKKQIIGKAWGFGHKGE